MISAGSWPRAVSASSASTTATSANPASCPAASALTPMELLKLRFLKIPVAAPYKLCDMAQDTVGADGCAENQSAHLVGASMGGMIAQEIAISFPERVRSLTSIMSTTGNPKIPPPTREATAVLMAPPPSRRERIHRALRPDLEGAARGSFPGRRSARSHRAPNATSSAASIRPASAGSSARFSPQAAARNGWHR